MARLSSQPETGQRPEHFAKVSGSPGAAPRMTGLLRLLAPLFLLCFVAGYLARAAWHWPPMQAPVIGAAFLFMAGVLAVMVTRGRERLESFLKGARGEEWVARTLAFLPATYRVYHGLRMPPSGMRKGTDYDHVVIGPTGLFLIETKNWSGRISIRDGMILYNGEIPDRPPLEQVKTAAQALRRELREVVHRGIEVQPVLCFAEGYLPDGQTGAAGVLICTSHTLVDALLDPTDTPVSRGILDQVAHHLEQQLVAQG